MVRLGLVLLAAGLISPALAGQLPGALFAVGSSSMEPAIPRGSLVLAGPADVGPGDVIVYAGPTDGHLVHRVVGSFEVDGETYYRTRGDSNPQEDPFPVPAGAVLGVVRHHIPFVGFPWILTPAAAIALFAGSLLLYLSMSAWDAHPAPRRYFENAARWMGVMVFVTMLVVDVSASVAVAYPASTRTAAVNTPTPLPMGAGTMGSATIAGDQNSATVTAAAPKLWKEVQMWGCAPSATVPPTCSLDPAAVTYATQAGSITKVNAADYDGTTSFYFEAYMAAATGLGIFVQLFDKTGGAAVAGTEVTTTSTTAVLVRSASFTLSGDKEYQFQTRETGVGAGKIYSVKLVSSQQFPTKTETQVPISFAGRTTSATFAVPPGGGKWLYEGGETDGTITAFFDAVVDVSGNTGTIRLMDRTTATSVASVTTTSATTARVRSTAFTLTSGDEYEVEFKVGAGRTLNLHIARVVVQQSGFSKTVRYEDLSWTTTTTATTYQTLAYPAQYSMGTEWGGVTGYLEATISDQTAGATTSVRLYDNTAAAVVAGSDISATGTTRVRTRSPAITLNLADPATYSVQFKASAGTAEMRNAWLIVYQANGKTYDHALQTRNDVVGSCTWSFTLAHVSSSGLARLTSATLSIRGGSLQDQIKVASGVVTQTTGAATTVAFGSRLEHLVATNPSSSGSSTITADLLGACGGVHSVQRVTYTVT